MSEIETKEGEVLIKSVFATEDAERMRKWKEAGLFGIICYTRKEGDKEHDIPEGMSEILAVCPDEDSYANTFNAHLLQHRAIKGGDFKDKVTVVAHRLDEMLYPGDTAPDGSTVQ